MCLGTIGQLTITFTVSNEDIKEIQNLFNVSYSSISTIIFTVLLIITFKKYYIFCLLEDIVNVRSAKLRKGDIFCLTVTVSVIGILYIIMNYAMVTLVLHLKYKHLYIVLMLIYSNISFMLLWNITLLLCITVVIISREFQKCIDELEIELNKRDSLTTTVLSQNLEIFKQLISTANKADSMFSFAVGIILTTTLSTSCGAIYAVLIGKSLGIFYSAVASCAAILGLLLLWLPSLNHKVRRNLPFHYLFIPLSCS